MEDYTKKELRGSSIENLYATHFLGEAYNAHSAYGDAIATEIVYHHSSSISVVIIKSNNKKH